jgi:hypothetical protein
MDLARYVVDAVVVEGRSYREVARARGVSKSWVGKLVGRFRAGGYPAIEARFGAARHIRVSAPPGPARPSSPKWKGQHPARLGGRSLGPRLSLAAEGLDHPLPRRRVSEMRS